MEEEVMAWFRKKSPAPSSPATDRYDGKPLLILLENYVLDVIGHFPQEKVATIASAVQHAYGGGADWKATLRSTLQLDDSIDDHLRQMWNRNQQIAQQSGVPLAPEEFARMVVDQNFASLIN